MDTPSRKGRLHLPGSPPRIIAHRGFALRHPENSLGAFKAAVDAGVAGIELDIHRAASGEAVVYHDFTLERLHGDPRAISGMELRELAPLGIPLLEELFQTFGSGIFYDIEIKSRQHGPSGVEAEAIRLIRRYGLEERVVISSFNPHALRAAARIAPAIPRAVIYAPAKDVPVLLRRGWGRFAVGVAALKPRWDQVTPGFVRRFRNRYAVLPWTVDDPEEARRLCALGVDGIITNEPIRITEALGDAS